MFLLLIWLYYSWDIARGFYPKSANELCQVAKINDSLLGLKYQFPIERKRIKKYSLKLKKKMKILEAYSTEIQNSGVSAQQKEILNWFS